MQDTISSGLIRANFSLRGFAKVVRHSTLSAFTPDAGSLVSFGRFLASLTISNEAPVTFVSIPEFRGIDYAGYIIEKERLDKSNGTWIRLEEFKIIGARANSFKDSRIAYGEVYRYRIRAVAKFTTFKTDSKTTNSEVAQELVSIIQTQIQSNIDKNKELIANIAQKGLQSKSSAGFQAPSVKLGNNVNVTVDQNNVPKLQFDVADPASQSRISNLYGVLGSVQSTLASQANISDSQLATIKNRLKQAGVTIPDQIKIYVSEYLVSNPSRNWKYVTVTEDILPPAPVSMKLIPSSSQKSIALYWLTPANDQRDLASFNIYRRNQVGDPWAKLAINVPLGVGSFIDTDVTFGTKYIYAMTSVDKHGYESFLSTQIQAELNSSFEFDRVEKQLVWISGGGARPDELDTLFKKFYDVGEKIIAHKNIRIGASKTYAANNTVLLLRIKSLDTHETTEFVVNLANKNINDK